MKVVFPHRLDALSPKKGVGARCPRPPMEKRRRTNGGGRARRMLRDQRNAAREAGTRGRSSAARLSSRRRLELRLCASMGAASQSPTYNLSNDQRRHRRRRSSRVESTRRAPKRRHAIDRLHGIGAPQLEGLDSLSPRTFPQCQWTPPSACPLRTLRFAKLTQN